MNNQMKYGLIGLVIGGLAVWLLTAVVLNFNRTTVGSLSNQQVNSNTLDAHFIEQMIPHHEDAITMAKLAQTKAERTEIKQLAQNIINSQSAEIEQMKNWYKSWYSREIPTGDEVMNTHGMMSNNSMMHMGIRGDNSDLQSLEQSEDFDRKFLELMIPHHQMAVMMASMLKDGTQRPEMKKLADDIISAQTSEIDQMRSWLKEWDK